MSKIPILDGTTDLPKIRLNHPNLKSTGLLVLISPFLWWKVRTSPTNQQVAPSGMRRRSSTKGRFVKEVQLMTKTMKMLMIVDIYIYIFYNQSQWMVNDIQSIPGLLNVRALPGRKAEEDEEPKDDRPAALYLGRCTGWFFVVENLQKLMVKDQWGMVKDVFFLEKWDEMAMTWLFMGLFSWKSLYKQLMVNHLKSSFSHEKWRWHSYIIMQGMSHFQKGPLVVWTFQGKPLNLMT